MTPDDKNHVSMQDRRWILEQLMLHGYLQPQENADSTFIEQVSLMKQVSRCNNNNNVKLNYRQVEFYQYHYWMKFVFFVDRN
jgi:hypothetical protein